jgi:hypothetical protein
MAGIVPADVERWELDEFFGNSERPGAAVAADVLIVGHTHCAMELRYAPTDRKDRLVVNPGALVGEGARGTFGVLTIAPAGTFQFDAYFSADGAPAPVARRRL